MNLPKYILAAMFLLLSLGETYAIPATPFPKVIRQADGTTLTVVKKGDEFFHFHETIDGYLIEKNEKGIFHYATMSKDGKIQRTTIKANDAQKRNFSERQFVKQLDRKIAGKTLQEFTITRQKKAPRNTIHKAKAKFPKAGSPRSLVILVNFSDKSFTVPNSQEAFNRLLNEEGYSENGGTGSARDYFRDNTMGVLTPQFDVVGPYDLPHEMAYYGANDADGDVRATNMIVDACRAADDAGLDFTIYDTDNDGFLDNVFVYYAGHNEAEWGGDDTVWPHRWSIFPNSQYNGGNYDDSTSSVVFDGKTLYDYACTSELKNDTGNDMCGIGTFSHEFGHVLGLADMYATDGSDHHTVSDWSIMDSGAYLNQGRTPPGYNAFERFQLGFMTPTILREGGEKTLEPILTSNTAFLVAEIDTHNLVGDNPSPTEYFLLENRQKSGWDTYLPEHGMLLYRINYVEDDFFYNRPNNDPNAMGVDVLEADGIGSKTTLKGDPFPGTSHKDSVDLKLRSGVAINKQLVNIRENNGVIHFSYKNDPSIITDSTSLHFVVVPNSTHQAKKLNITTKNIYEGELNYEITGDNATLFTVTGKGTLPFNGGELYLNFVPTEEGKKTAQLKISYNNTDKYVDLIGNTPITPIDTPIVPENATNISKTNSSFTAIWQSVENAESYLVNIYTKNDVEQEKTVLTEDFATFTAGSTNNKPSSSDVSGKLDEFTSQSGWTGSKIYEAGGSIKLGTSSKKGSLITPTLDLSANEGNFSIEFDAMAWKGDADKLLIYKDDELAYEATGLDNQTYTLKSYSVSLTGGTNSTKISFESSGTSKARFFLDNIVIKQGKELVSKNVAVENSPFTTTETSYLYTDAKTETPYYYTVKAVKGEVQSANSKEVGPIYLAPTGVESLTIENLKVSVINGKLIVAANKGEMIEVYNTLGQKLTGKVANNNTCEITLPTSGIFIVKVGNRITKIVL